MKCSALEIQKLYFRAKERNETSLAAIALAALELGKDSNAWKRCKQILSEIPRRRA